MNPIASKASCHLNISKRLQNVALWYLLSLMIKTEKHSLTFAAKTSGLNKSQFSRFLQNSGKFAMKSLDKLVNYFCCSFLSTRDPFLPGTPWSIAIIVDATIQKRSTRVQNSQSFNHGKGFVIGHQWTNVVLIINGNIIPLPPIKFITKAERKRLNIKKETEHQCVARYLKDLDLTSKVGLHKNSEIVVLMDAGYDNKKIQNTIIERQWDFVSALKCSRSVKTEFEANNNYLSRRIENLFWACRKNSPWQTVRDYVSSWNGRKRKEFRARELLGYLAGVQTQVKLVLSEERGRRKGRKHLACSNINIDIGAIVRAYRRRWAVEIFHKEVKSLLGFEDVSCHQFKSIEAHVHWVYCAYLLLKLLKPKLSSLSERMDSIASDVKNQPFKEIKQRLTRFDGIVAAKSYCSEVIDSIKVA